MAKHVAMLVVTEQPLLSGVRLAVVRQLVRAVQRGGVPAIDLVRDDAQALPGDAAWETSGGTGGHHDRADLPTQNLTFSTFAVPTGGQKAVGRPRVLRRRFGLRVADLGVGCARGQADIGARHG
jgi:hypothetical protein